MSKLKQRINNNLFFKMMLHIFSWMLCLISALLFVDSINSKMLYFLLALFFFFVSINFYGWVHYK